MIALNLAKEPSDGNADVVLDTEAETVQAFTITPKKNKPKDEAANVLTVGLTKELRERALEQRINQR